MEGEAKKAMDIAERKITEKDYNGAKEFANKAQNLYPDLNGLNQLLMIIEVYISGEKKYCGETDWYGILGVDPLVDDEALRKQYRKLALMLHPDKNKCKGAEGAFQLISEAWSLLSDRSKRDLYNIKRQASDSTVRAPTTQRRNPPQQPTSNGFQNAREPVVSSARATTKPAARSRMDRSHVDSPAFVSSIQKKNTTFWTQCGECKTQYEYLRIYLNKTLLCPNCRVAFPAKEGAPPASVEKPFNLSSLQQLWSSKNQATNKKSFGTSSRRAPAPAVSHRFRWDFVSNMAGSSSQNATNQAANVVQQAQDRLKRGFGDSQVRDAARGFTNSKKSRTDDSHMSGPFAGTGVNPIGATRFSIPNLAKGNTETPNTIGDIPITLLNKSQQEIFARIPKMVSALVKDVEREMKSMKATSKTNEVERNDRSVQENSHDTDAEKEDEVVTISLPDSNFYNFDRNRTENSFEDDQIWAAYDADDGMPRFYARIEKVISLNPLKMTISWLSSKSCSEFGPINWIGSGFAKTCGDFRPGRCESTDTLNAFSHKVDFTKDEGGILHILPKKGQVWALYRNWSPDWDKNTPDEVIHKYEMVEVLDDYTQEKLSVTVVLLLKVEGFRAIFLKSTNEEDVRKIAKEEMFRFSHQVPHYLIAGNEGLYAPDGGCLELDPAATPCEILSENA